jgi:hypothetical protein
MTKAQQRETLLRKRQYKSALASLDESTSKHRRNDALYRERASLHLYLGSTQQARSDLDASHRLLDAIFRVRPGRLQSDHEFAGIGTTYWIEARQDLALAFWRYTTQSLYDGRVHYSRAGGGIETGLLLWFGAVHARRRDDIDLVRKLYKKRLASTFWSHNLTSWPGPLVHFFLKDIGEQDLLKSATNPRELCHAHFAVAIHTRAQGRYAISKKHLRVAADRPNPVEHYDDWCFVLSRFETTTR